MLTESRCAPQRDRSSLRVALTSLLCLLVSGCYVMQAAHGELDVLAKRRPIAKVVANPRTPPKLRSTLEQVERARDFATRALGLPRNASYRTYSDIGRPFVVWSVVAAPEFSVEPVHWCFPIVGCVAYRGYFKERSARRFAARLRSRGDDVTVGGVPAYSTLGRFADPVLSSMLDYGDVQLAGIIFHELTHQLLYVRGDTSFNEAFATTVEQEGVRRWLLLQGRTAELERYEAATRRNLEYIALFRLYRLRLAKLYSSGLPRPQMLARKRATFASLAMQVRALERQTHAPSPYRDWLDTGLNNADLASVATYYDCVPGFQRLLQEEGGDLKRFYADVRALAREPAHQRDAAVCASLSDRSPRGSD
ncbi:MAG: aminopeptidase [Steroidobacteraceae bacterium]